jgi:carboxyl-terminal processing protease
MKITKRMLAFSYILLASVVFVVSIGLVNPFGFFAYDEMRKLNETVRILKSAYYENFDKKVFADGAARGAAGSLGDEYTEFMDTKTAENFKKNVEGKFSGVGLYITKQDGFVTVALPIEGSPAEKAGIGPGDRIVEVDGKEITGTDDASDAMLGEPGTNVDVTVIKSGTGEKKSYTLARENITIKSVKQAEISDIGYILISQFAPNTAEEFRSAVQAVQSEGLHKLIVDLRNNPGGTLDSAVEICGMFVPEGKNVVYTVGKRGERQEYNAKSGDKVSMDVCVLINGMSASASEIFAGCMKDYGLATLVGEKTYGKGVVQEAINLSDKSLLKVTVSRYFTPSGVSIDKDGVEPDIQVKSTRAFTQPMNVSSIGQSLNYDTQLSAAVDYLDRK